MARLSSLIQDDRGRLLLLSAVPLVVFFWSGTTDSRFASESNPSAGAAGSAQFQWQGVASCAATACHGGNASRGKKGSEYATWVLKDRHNQAYQKLLDDRSRLIEKNLRPFKNLNETHAEKDQLCLRCHAMNAENGPQGDLFDRSYGIGCESCHGPAQAWLGLHYGRGWKNASDENKRKLGFRSLRNLAERAQLCVSCHVGDSNKEVNHDLIAAGHPRLNFEFGAFQANMPPHWREQGDNAQPDFEARAWAVGQIVSTQAALTLLKHRARTAMPWPEFAEYDCFACHHDLQESSWRQQSSHYTDHKRGSFVWGSWYYPLLPETLLGLASNAETQLKSILKELKSEMQKALPDSTRVKNQASQASTKLDEFLREVEGRRYDRTTLERKLESIRRDKDRVATANWDGAVQVCLALAALYHALSDLSGGRADPALRDALKARAKGLRFLPGYDSPKDFEPEPGGNRRQQVPR
jgi:hypothetical protein